MATNDVFEQGDLLPFTGWAPVLGQWEVAPERARYMGASDPERAFGTLLSGQYLSDGWAGVKMRVESEEADPPQARLVFGWDPQTTAHFAVGIGGYGALYVLEEF